jgi:hypothetical protein
MMWIGSFAWAIGATDALETAAAFAVFCIAVGEPSIGAGLTKFDNERRWERMRIQTVTTPFQQSDSFF